MLAPFCFWASPIRRIRMKNEIVLILSVSSLPCVYGCALGAASAGYALKATTADDLSSNKKKEIVDEAVEKCFDKVKNYISENCQPKSK